MRITLKQWKQIEHKVRDMGNAVNAASHKILLIAMDHPAESVERDFLLSIAKQIEASAENLPAAYLFHPQSEWLGGDSGNPKNHCLKEPNCIPGYHKRRFSPEEISEAGLECHGPCQWCEIPL